MCLKDAASLINSTGQADALTVDSNKPVYRRRGVLEDLPAKLPPNIFFYLIIALIVNCRFVVVTD